MCSHTTSRTPIPVVDFTIVPSLSIGFLLHPSRSTLRVLVLLLQIQPCRLIVLTEKSTVDSSLC
jgi:hypothetical protein